MTTKAIIGFVVVLYFLIAPAASNEKKEGTTVLHTTLHNGQTIPLVGFGVGNLQQGLIESQVAESVPLGFRLVDTAHASHNEHLILQGMSKTETWDDEPMHVVTKVWYTYLGYERTIISVRESLQALNNTQRIRVHMLLHWPRCRNDISWMDCAGEEEKLPQSVKKAGPPPHLDKDHAFKESWRALEDIYLGHIRVGENLPKLASIGVSNFDKNDLQDLATTARISPHIIQLNVWSIVFDPHLTEYCRKHKIHLQAYNVMNGIVGRKDVAPYAYGSLWDVAKSFSSQGDEPWDPARVLLTWLVQQNVSVIPRTSNRRRLATNSPKTIAKMDDLSKAQQDRVEEAVRALLSGQDLSPPRATFVNQHSDVLHLFWSNIHQGEEVPVKMDLAPGETWDTQTFAGHVFVAYDGEKKQRREFTIRASYGENEKLVIDEL